ncbi:potassium-transporting ATPase subunit KdpC [Nitratidesulfovibrio liaohensis]|uniref:Potassium-transporting ATPase KdpC subunit n=1 Tax=Nitratidesulfovibrio liaohensis TaxID=2604158 RepID=A0ABY9QZF9_9BACT|nr:potassium-transporting ATPase subunit KdpC [Nitratidesulfovibrio liaohensis]WMW64915.1 potassium-transporting ATPase subunit KdpC [Nitratidesulfovibrio liaohensis]
MLTLVRQSLVVTLLLAALLCGAYPVLVTGAAQALLPHKANGSPVVANGQVTGSDLIGQHFTEAGHFHGRPSAAGDDGYDAAASGGSNLGPTSRALAEAMQARAAALRAENPDWKAPLPPDMVTASASGLDPHVSPEGARMQVARVAAARGLSAAKVTELVEAHVEGPQLGLFGEPRVNVLRLNLALDALAGERAEDN